MDIIDEQVRQLIDIRVIEPSESLFLYMAYKKPTIWSALDLLSGYHQCIIEEDSRPYTDFETPMEVYQYRRVPFGLVGAHGNLPR